MRTSGLVPLLLSAIAVACSGPEPAPTESRPEFGTSPCSVPTVSANPKSVSRPAQSTQQATFTVVDNCGGANGTWELFATRTGAVSSIVTQSAATVTLTTGQAKTVTVSYTTGSPGSGTVVLQAFIENPPAPLRKSSGTLIVTVTTPSGSAPTVTTNAASAISTTGATVNGSANPNGASTTGWFRYSTTNPGNCNDTFGTRSPATGGSALGAGTSAVAYSRVFTGLNGGTTYYFCAIAGNSSGTGLGTVRSFTPSAAPKGIPYGPFGVAPNTLGSGTIWTGLHIAGQNPTTVLNMLQAAKNRSIGMWFNLTGGNEQYRKADGSFDLVKWKNTFDSHVGSINADGTSSFYLQYRNYIKDGTYQGTVLLDDLGDFNGGDGPTFDQVEAMSAHSKKRFPTLPTAVRTTPEKLERISTGRPYTQLDAGWAQYRSDQGTPEQYRDKMIEIARRLDLGLVLGINITNGIYIRHQVFEEPSPATILAWGRKLLEAGTSDYVCGFLMWDEQYTRLGASEFATLADVAKNHVKAPCKRR